MARKGVLGFCWRRLPSVLFRTQRAARRLLFLAFILPLSFFPLRAQLQQPFVFSTDLTNPSSIDVYTRNDITGVLTPVVGSPFPSREPVSVMTLDFKGRFLFTASSNVSKISMFTVNPDREPFKRFPIRRLLPLPPTSVSLRGEHWTISLCRRFCQPAAGCQRRRDLSNRSGKSRFDSVIGRSHESSGTVPQRGNASQREVLLCVSYGSKRRGAR
jgi:hypothetical protein